MAAIILSDQLKKLGETATFKAVSSNYQAASVNGHDFGTIDDLDSTMTALKELVELLGGTIEVTPSGQ